MLLAWVPLVVAVIAALVYALSDSSKPSGTKVQALALHSFLAAMVSLMLVLAKHTIHIP